MLGPEQKFLLINDDWREAQAKFPDNSVDCIVTDCPYKIVAGGVRVVYVGDDTKTDWTKSDPKGILARGHRRVSVVSDGSACSDKWLKKDGKVPSAARNGKMFAHNKIKFSDWLPSLYRILKPKSHCYIFVNGRNLARLQMEAEKCGFVFQQLIVWKKQNATPNKFYMNTAEFVLMLSKRPARNINFRGFKNVLEIRNIIGKKKHPTEKPVELLKIFVLNSTNPGDTILDPFCGGGSTGEATVKENRRFIGCDIDAEHYATAQTTLETAARSLAQATLI